MLSLLSTVCPQEKTDTSTTLGLWEISTNVNKFTKLADFHFTVHCIPSREVRHYYHFRTVKDLHKWVIFALSSNAETWVFWAFHLHRWTKDRSSHVEQYFIVARSLHSRLNIFTNCLQIAVKEILILKETCHSPKCVTLGNDFWKITLNEKYYPYKLDVRIPLSCSILQRTIKTACPWTSASTKLQELIWSGSTDIRTSISSRFSNMWQGWLSRIQNSEITKHTFYSLSILYWLQNYNEHDFLFKSFMDSLANGLPGDKNLLHSIHIIDNLQQVMIIKSNFAC